jgi:hypothetical protein
VERAWPVGHGACCAKPMGVMSHCTYARSPDALTWYTCAGCASAERPGTPGGARTSLRRARARWRRAPLRCLWRWGRGPCRPLGTGSAPCACRLCRPGSAGSARSAQGGSREGGAGRCTCTRMPVHALTSRPTIASAGGAGGRRGSGGSAGLRCAVPKVPGDVRFEHGVGTTRHPATRGLGLGRTFPCLSRRRLPRAPA